MELIDSVVNFFTSPLFRLIVRLVVLYIGVLWLATVVWTYRDAKHRGALAVTWAVVALVFPFVGLLVYLLLRPSEYAEDREAREIELEFKKSLVEKELQRCPACNKPVEDDFQICPYCLKKLKKPCKNCSRLLRLEWHVCPYCKSEQ